MELEIFNTMRTSVTLGLEMLLEIIVALTTLFVIAGFAIYLGGIVWLCCEEMRQSPQHRKKTAPEPLEPVALAMLDDDLGEYLASSVTRRECERRSPARSGC